MINVKNYLKKCSVKRLRSLKMKLFEFELQGINQAYFLSLVVLCMSGSVPADLIGRSGGKPSNQERAHGGCGRACACVPFQALSSGKTRQSQSHAMAAILDCAE